MFNRFLVFIVLTFNASFVTSKLTPPSHASLASLSEAELAAIVPTLQIRSVEQPPGPLKDTSPKLVNDKDHPWKPLRPGDIRGPCPGLNTLASHGYLPRNGIATPAQIVGAVQEGFNMGNDLAVFVTYATFIVDGNPLTNLLSIGRKSSTGNNPPKPAIVGGLNTHDVFEGDASITRADAFFGDNHDFNETLFDQFSKFSTQFGGGNYNLAVAAQLRHQRIQQSIKTNPQFSFVSPRYFGAFAESIFPLEFFVDGRQSNSELNMAAARGFFQNNSMPNDFFRARKAIGIDDIAPKISTIFSKFPIQPGRNKGVGNYVLDPTSADFNSGLCLAYTNFVNQMVRSLYPSPTGSLRNALNANLDIFFRPLKAQGCTQVFPYGH